MLIGVFLTGNQCFLRRCPHNGVFCASGRCFFATVAGERRRRRRRRRRRPDAAPVRHAVALLPLPPFDSALPNLLESQDEVSGGGLPCPLCNTMTSLHASSTWDLGAVALLQLVWETGVGLPLNRTAVFCSPSVRPWRVHVLSSRSSATSR